LEAAILSSYAEERQFLWGSFCIMPASNQRHSKTAGHRPTWAEIDLDALAANFQLVRRHVGPAVKVLAVVKANAYGHGAVECARRLEREGAPWFGVATPEEAIELRESGIVQPILCLGGFWEDQEAACLRYQLTPAVYRFDLVSALDRAAKDAGVMADVHVKIDTGMGRLGVRFDQVGEFAEALKRFQNIRVDGLMTHFAAADDPACGALTVNQVQRFEQAVTTFREQGYRPTHYHLANSAGVFAQPSAWGNMVRPGGVLYGLWRDVLAPANSETIAGVVSRRYRAMSDSGRPELESATSDRQETELDSQVEGTSAHQLQPVMSLRSSITLLKWVPAGDTIGYGCTYEASRQTLVATVPIGYNDGYLRGLTNRGRVIVRGSYASVIGRISMDLTLVDVTNVPGVQLDDVVTLLGPAAGNSGLAVAAEDVAKTAGTISYELTCGISQRVPRIYLAPTNLL
jgi:alanine racemase